MSVALFIVTEREIDGLDPFVNGKAVGSANEKTLRKICERVGVRPLDQFISQDPDELREMLEDGGLAVPEAIPDRQWFEAADGLATVRALRAHLEANPEAIRNAAAIVNDLTEYETVLARLAQERVRWCFQVDF